MAGEEAEWCCNLLHIWYTLFYTLTETCYAVLLSRYRIMASITLTAEQKKAIERAKASGKRRIVMDLTEGQRAALKKADAEVESEKEEITRMARQAFAERKAFETELVKATCLLAAAREERGITLAKLAELTGMTRQALSRIERGENKNPTFSTLQRIAAALGKEVIIKMQDVA